MTKLRFLHYTDGRITVYEYSDGTYKVLGYILKTIMGWFFRAKRPIDANWQLAINLKLRELNDVQTKTSQGRARSGE